VLKTCPADQGCANSACVPACDSAKANKSTIGCDYYAANLYSIEGARGNCFAAYIANTWDADVGIEVEYGGQSLDVSQFARIPSGNGKAITYAPLPNGKLPIGQVAILFLSQAQQGPDSPKLAAPCPAGVGVGLMADPSIDQTGTGNAFHIKTSAPIVAYDIFPYGGGSSAVASATLLLPTTSWDTNYVAVDAFRKGTADPNAQPIVAIVAGEDGTDVTIGPTAAIVGKGSVMGTPKGQPITYHLGSGALLQFVQDEELVGSPIQSNKPIGVWGGASCLFIDVDKFACDAAHQQIPPVKALGNEYVAVRYRNRFDGQEEAPPWRIVGAVANTMLTYEPAPPNGAPSTLTLGQVAEFRAPGPFVVKSQDNDHPFYMSGHMTGCTEVNPAQDDCRGDPEFVNIIPPNQFLPSYTFFTDPTYPETNLVLVRKKGDGGFSDVELDCAGKLTGWTAIDKADTYEFTRIDLVRHNFEKQGNCDNGRHEIKSAAPFGLTVWGWGNTETAGFVTVAVSYAFPAGASVQPINMTVVPPVPK
jgi:hypothetical protein